MIRIEGWWTGVLVIIVPILILIAGRIRVISVICLRKWRKIRIIVILLILIWRSLIWVEIRLMLWLLLWRYVRRLTIVIRIVIVLLRTRWIHLTWMWVDVALMLWTILPTFHAAHSRHFALLNNALNHRRIDSVVDIRFNVW